MSRHDGKTFHEVGEASLPAGLEQISSGLTTILHIIGHKTMIIIATEGPLGDGATMICNATPGTKEFRSLCNRVQDQVDKNAAEPA